MKRDKEPPTFLENASSYFSQFCGATSIHGMQYLGERKRFLVEKAIWTVILTGVCYLCVFLILKAYDKWVTSPVIVTFATTETPISKIPFPAITICPEVKTDPSIFNFTEIVDRKIRNDNFTKEEEVNFESLCLVCDGFVTRSLLAQGQGSLFVDDSVVENLKTLSYGSLLSAVAKDKIPPIKAQWLNSNDTDKLVSIDFTEAGLCFVFNAIDPAEMLRNPEDYLVNYVKNASHADKWSWDEGYPNDDPSSYPLRTFVPGVYGGASFEMYTNHSYLDYLCGLFSQGFRVVVHHPAEPPNINEAFRVPLDSAVFVAVKPRMITVSEQLRHYQPQNRKCYFTHERPLRFFTNYTQNNCLLECLSNYTLIKCNCIGFYMPKDKDSNTCGVGSKQCMEQSAVNYLKGDDKDCDCLPSCTSLEYDIEIFQSQVDWRKQMEIIAKVSDKPLEFDLEKDYTSFVFVYFKEMQFLSSQRQELYTYVDFFANTGGLLGLFVGFSVTSAIEILYFLTLRLGCNIIRYGKRFWSGDQELVDAHQENTSGGL